MQKSDIEIEFINFEEFWDESKSYPVGILYISAFLKKSGFTNIGLVDHVCILRKIGEYSNAPFEGKHLKSPLESLTQERRHSLDNIFQHMQQRQPHVVLLGPITTPHLIELTDLVPRLREKYTEQIILAGGPHFGKDANLDTELLENCSGLDGIVVGEAEETTTEVVTQFYTEFCRSGKIPSRVEFQTKLAEICGIAVRGKKLKPRNPPNLNDLPPPDMELLETHLGDPWTYFNNPKYRLSNRRNPITWVSRSTVESFDGEGDGATEDDVRYFDYHFASKDNRFPFGVIVGSRGCPYKCSFCCSQGNRRVQSANYIFKQMFDLHKRYGIRLFVFFDSVFTDSSLVDQKRIKELCEMICDSGIDIRYMIEIRADAVRRLPEDLLSLVIRSGCAEFNFGFEKGSNKMLQKMMKGTSITDHREAVARLRRISKKLKTRVIINGTFILGGPGETKMDVRETLMHCLDLHLDQATIYPLEIHPGTQVNLQARKEGILEPGLTSYLNPAEYPLHSTENLPRSYLTHVQRKSEAVLDEMEEFRKTMQGFERQFLSEDERDGFSSFEIEKTEQLNELIKECIDVALDYLRKHPAEGLRLNEHLASEVDAAIRKVDEEIDEVENKLVQKYPDYHYQYGDYYPGTLRSDWKRFLELFEELFSTDNFP